MSDNPISERLTITKNFGPDKGMAKISVNMNPSTLSSIDLLVDHGYYSNRSDFINQAVRDAIMKHQSTIDRIADDQRAMRGRHWFLGLFGLTAEEVAGMTEDDPVTIRGYGVMTIDRDCDEEKLFACVKSIDVRGKVIASESVKKHYGI